MHVSAHLAILIHSLYSLHQSRCFGPGTLCLMEEDRTHYIFLHPPSLVLALPGMMLEVQLCARCFGQMCLCSLREKLSFALLPCRGSSQRTAGTGSLWDQRAKSAGSLRGTWQDQPRRCPVQLRVPQPRACGCQARWDKPPPLRCQLARGRLAPSLVPCPAYERPDTPRPGLFGCLTLHCIIFLPRAARLLPWLSHHASTANVDSVGPMARERTVG